jgi:hypothetical protein
MSVPINARRDSRRGACLKARNHPAQTSVDLDESIVPPVEHGNLGAVWYGQLDDTKPGQRPRQYLSGSPTAHF